MKNLLCKIVLSALLLWGAAGVSRANDLEYRMEVGGMAGVSSYYGDRP